MNPPGRHVDCEGIVSGFPNVLDACAPIGSEEEAEELGHEIIEFTAIVHFNKHGAIGATTEAVLGGAGADFAPSGFRVLGTARACTGEVLPAGAAIQSASGYKVGVGVNFAHWNVLPF
jgi:hypothetical protein